MQTFLPYKSFTKSAASLDWRRLGKQRVENLQLMQALVGWRVISNNWAELKDTDDPFYDGTEESLVPDSDEDVAFETRYLDQLPDCDRITWLFQPLPNSSWSNHPAARMWRGHEWALLQYQRAIVDEWILRGHTDTCWHKTRALFIDRCNRQLPDRRPPWLGDKDFHLAHQSNLVRKDPEHYRPQFPDVPDDLPYIWPVD